MARYRKNNTGKIVVSSILATVLGAGIALGVVYREDIKKWGDETFQKVEDTFKPDDSGSTEKPDDSGSTETPDENTPVVLRLEAEDAVLTGGTIKSVSTDEYGDGSASGSWVGDLDESGSNVAFNVKIETAGTYQVRVSYATCMENSTLHWYIEPYVGMNADDFSFPATSNTGAWGIFAVTTINRDFVLDSGDYTFTLTKSVNSVEVDYVEFVLIEETTTDEETNQESENSAESEVSEEN